MNLGSTNHYVCLEAAWQYQIVDKLTHLNTAPINPKHVFHAINGCVLFIHSQKIGLFVILSNSRLTTQCKVWTNTQPFWWKIPSTPFLSSPLNQVMEGVGSPVNVHVSSTRSPSCTVTSAGLDASYLIFGASEKSTTPPKIKVHGGIHGKYPLTVYI